MSEKKLAKVFYADVWGLRSEKYDYLFKNDVKTIKWQKLEPVEPYYFFVPKDFALLEEYKKFWKVTEIFKEYSSGVQSKRDNLAVNFERNILRTNFYQFVNLNLPDEFIKRTFRIDDTYEWILTQARKSVKKENIDEMIEKYCYHPFDQRWIYYSDAIIARPFKRVMKHLLNENIAIATSRKYPGTKNFGAFVVALMGDIHSVADQTYFFPLYLYLDNSEGQIFDEKTSKQERIPNFTPEFLKAIKETLNKEPSPEEIFYYIYAVHYSSAYRKRYEEFLKIDFPRIPLLTNYKLFKILSNLGKELVDVHLLRHPALSETEIGFPESGSNIVEKVSYDEKTKRVYINKNQYFEGVSNQVWQYRIGAYQIMQKYLKDRKARKLSLDEINQYMKVAKALRLTIELQEEIDNIYENLH
ncbi:MAG: type ISP restriction/modification enzyme [Candidatus Aminicenantia bacterium]